jgi:hemerythrin superfamily protein
MNALELLALDHEKLGDLFDQLQEADEFEDKQDIYELIREELTLHTDAEEAVFYPAIAELQELEELAESSLADHDRMIEMLQEIDEIEDESDFDSKLDELQDILDQHIDQEENEVFPKVRRQMDERTLEQLGQRIAQNKTSHESHAA